MIDHNGDLEWWNQAAEQMLGLSANSDRGQPITYLLRNPKLLITMNNKTTLTHS